MRPRTAVMVACRVCGTQVSRQPNQLAKSKHTYCSTACLGRANAAKTKELSPSWKGGVTGHVGGYVRVKVGRDHPMADATGYVLEHRLVMANAIGRMLLPTEIVHHINHTRGDNRRENLRLYSSPAEHLAQHKKHRKCWCGRPHEARGMCTLHYLRWLLNRNKERAQSLPSHASETA